MQRRTAVGLARASSAQAPLAIDVVQAQTRGLAIALRRLPTLKLQTGSKQIFEHAAAQVSSMTRMCLLALSEQAGTQPGHAGTASKPLGVALDEGLQRVENDFGVARAGKPS